MDFGPAVRPAADTSAATWLLPWLWAMPGGVVGDLLPGGFERYLFVDDVLTDHEATEEVDRHWDASQGNAAMIGDIAARHTATPDEAYFAIWVGHGYSNEGLEHIPIFEDQHHMRDYYLLQGPVAAVTELTEPNLRPEWPRWWRQPDLWWPQDRAWMVATDVDIGPTYVGGTAALCDEIAGVVTTETHLVDRNDELEGGD